MTDKHWFDKMSVHAQRIYIKKHPNSIYAKRVKRGPTAKERSASLKVHKAKQKIVSEKNEKVYAQIRELTLQYSRASDFYGHKKDLEGDARKSGDAKAYAAAKVASDEALDVCKTLDGKIQALRKKMNM